MVKAATCETIFRGHCHHWGLTEAAHALVHAAMRRMDEIYEQDVRSGKHALGTGSESSVADDGSRLEALLLDEGYRVVPA